MRRTNPEPRSASFAISTSRRPALTSWACPETGGVPSALYRPFAVPGLRGTSHPTESKRHRDEIATPAAGDLMAVAVAGHGQRVGGFESAVPSAEQPIRADRV